MMISKRIGRFGHGLLTDPSYHMQTAIHVDSLNPVIRSGALDLIGYSYNQDEYYKDFPTTYPGKKLIGSETISSLATRGCYDMPSDSIRRWPARWDHPINNRQPRFYMFIIR